MELTCASMAPKDQARSAARQVRRTVDLTYEQHIQLVGWCSETVTIFGTARVTGQEVFRALVDRLLTDPLLACQIRADLATQVLSGMAADSAVTKLAGPQNP
jgi:hypothetical protein